MTAAELLNIRAAAAVLGAALDGLKAKIPPGLDFDVEDVDELAAIREITDVLANIEADDDPADVENEIRAIAIALDQDEPDAPTDDDEG